MSEFRRRLMMMQRAGESFPAELQKCEWISNNWSAYIILGYNVNNKTCIECDILHGVELTGQSIIGQYNGSFRFNVQFYQGGVIFEYADKGYVQTGMQRYVWYNFRTELGALYIDGNLVADLGTSTRSKSNLNFGVFRHLLGTNVGNAGLTELKNFKIRENGNELYNLLPCYIKPGKTFKDIKGNTCPAGTIGMYDTVNGDFYTNDGTGTFTKGADI